MRSTCLFATCIPLLFGIAPLRAQAPDSVSFQGYVTDSGGNPLNSAGLSMTFKLYDDGTEIWTETQPSVVVADGLFNVLLGSVTPLDTVRFNRPLELGISLGGDPEIIPRTPLAAAAYAKALPGFYTKYDSDATYRGYNVVGGGPNNVVAPGRVGSTIGGGGGFATTCPLPCTALANVVDGHFATVSGGLANQALTHQATVAGGSSNIASGSGNSTVSGGNRNSASGFASTVIGGEDNVASGGLSVAAGGTNNIASGAYSFAAGTYASAEHEGSFVWNDRSTNFETFASTDSNQFLIRAAGGVGIGTNSPRSDAQLDVNGAIHVRTATLLFHGTSASGLVGQDDGVRFRYFGDFGGDGDHLIFEKTDANQNAPDGGIAFVNTGADGVMETALQIHGSGSVEVPGNLSKGSGSFKIDHPLDPTNKYLYHSFVESPDMKNVYDGVVALDAEGEAVVELPAYFEALNRDFRYQLTAIGAPGPNLYVSKEIDGNTFGIAGGDPGMRVSWMVTGIRKDPFAAQNPIEVEVDKSPTERGTYLHPKAYGITR